MKSGFNRIFLPFILVVIMFGGCCKDCDKCPENCPFDPPADTAPTIVVLMPPSLQALNFRNDVVTITLRLDDDWALDSFWLKETWTSVTGQDYVKVNSLVSSRILSGTNWIEQITYTVPGPLIQDYSTITLTGCASDNKGQTTCKSVTINVLPEPGSALPYEVQSYSGCEDTIFSVLTGGNFNYSFLMRSNSNGLAQSLKDIGEASVVPSFSAVLETPNQLGSDSTIVMTSQAVFNYDSLTWQTAWEAYVTSNQIGAKSQPLQAGDIVIIKMVTIPQFAIMRICKTFNAQSAGIVFDYKYTYEP